MPVTCAAAFWLTNLAAPGLAFIQATRPRRSLAGKFFCASMSCGLIDSNPIGVKSVCRS
jgi:hypothetical protein